MLKLITLPAAFGEPSGSAFSTKILILAKLAAAQNPDFKWERVDMMDPRKAPKGKLPLLDDNGTIVPDSDQIRHYIEDKFNIDFDAGLDASERAHSHALIRMTEENIYFAAMADRWMNDANWEAVREEFFGAIPAFLRKFITGKIRKSTIADLKGQGMGRHNDADRFERTRRDIDAIITTLGDRKYIMGDEPGSVDAVTVPMLRAFLTVPHATLTSDYVRSQSKLMAYLERGAAELYPT